MGLPLDLLTMDQTVDACLALAAEGRPTEQVSLNAAKIVMTRDDPRIRDVILNADLVSADGQGVLLAGRFLGLDVPERVAGIDLMEHLLAAAERESLSVYFLGATEEVLARFLEVVAERYPRLVVAGAHNGYFDDDAAIAESIARAGARFLFVAMPSPRKELFVSANLCRVGPLLAMGVGGSFDVWAGKVSRAPRWMRSAGLEWLHRLISEPRKMWRRNVVGSSRFAAMVLAERFRPR